MKNLPPEIVHAELDKFVASVSYRFMDGFSLRIVKMSKCWHVIDNNGPGGHWPFQRMDGKKVSNEFKTFADAQEGVREILRYMKSPLTRREIRHWFNSRWIRGEEQAGEFRSFKAALLDGRWEHASRIYNKVLTRHSREAVPFRVHYQVCINLPGK